MFRSPLAFVFAGVLAAQTPLETPLQNNGKPMRVAYDCSAAETQAAGLSCSEQDPCPVYLELSNIDAAGSKIFIAGNIHTPMATLDSILLASDDDGKTWAEPHPRIRQAGLDQIQFVGSDHGWISGANLQGAPRDPFFLITSDGGKTWREKRVFEEDRVAVIQSFDFGDSSDGSLTIDARLDGGKIESYKTSNGGESWVFLPITGDGFSRRKPPAWRLRTDASTHSYVVEHSGQKIASFLVNIATCKE